jgi:hypothetical protein
MTLLSRREMARLVAGMAATRAMLANAQTPAESTYVGPLTGVDKGIEDRRFDPVAHTLDLYAEAPRRLRFQARTRREAEDWQKTLRAKVTELVGGFPSERRPLRPVVLETRSFPGYRREKVVFDSRPGVSVLAYVLVPEGRPKPPVMICVPGHGRGVDDIVGIDAAGAARTDKPGYAHDFAIQVAEAGLAAVAIEPMAFGCRRDAISARKGLTANAC